MAVLLRLLKARSMWSRIAVLWFLLSAASLVWPIYPWLGNRIHPRVLGLPWSLVWVLIIVALNFAVLLVLYHFRVVDDREVDEDPTPSADLGGPPS